jgi:hypothetical protein
MSYGVEIRNSSDRLIFDTSTQCMSHYDTIFVGQNNAGSRSYPELAGHTISAVPLWNFASNSGWPLSAWASSGAIIVVVMPEITYNNSGAYPTVTWSTNFNPSYQLYAPTQIWVYVNTAPNTSSYGVLVKNNDSEVIISDFTSNYNFIGKATVTSIVEREDQLHRGWYIDTIAVANITSSSNDVIAFVEDIVGQKASVVMSKKTSATNHEIVISYTGGGTTPKIYCFEDVSSSSNDGYGLRIYDADNSLLFDASNNPLNARASCDYVAAGVSRTTGPYWTMPDTTLLAKQGSIPTNSATFCPGAMQYQSAVYYNGEPWSKGFLSGVTKKSDGNLYSCWSGISFDSGLISNRTFSKNLGMNFKTYTIDTTQYE